MFVSSLIIHSFFLLAGKPIFYDVSIDRTTFSPSQDINFKIRSSPHHDPHHQLVYLGFSLNEYYVISGSMHQQQQQQHQKTTELIEDESANTYITRKLSDTESFTTVPTAGNSGERFFSSLSDIFDPNSMQLDGAGTGTAGPTTLNLGRKFRITGKNKYLVWSESEKELPPVSEINGSLLRRGSATSNNSTLSSTLITKFTHSNKNLDLNSGVGRRFRMTVPPVSDVYPSGNWHKIKVKHKIKITLRFVTSQSPRRGSKASLNSTERRNSNLDQPKLVIVEKIIECPVTVTSFNTLMAEAANGFIQRFGVKADPTFTTSTDGHDAIMVSEQKQPISPPPPTRASIFNGPTIIVHEPELHPPLSTVDEAAAAATSTTISAVALSSQMPELLKPNTNHHRVEMEYDLPPLSPSFSAEIIDNRNSPSRLMDMINEEEYDERKSGEVGEATGADEDLASSTVSSDHPKTPPKTSSDIPSIMRLTTNYAAATETNDYQQQKQNEQQLMLNLQPKLFIPPPPLYSPPAFLKANHERISFLQPTSASEAAATLDGEEEEDDDEDDEVAAALTNAVQKLSPTAISLSTYSSPIKSKAQRGRNHQSINVLQLAHLADEFYNHSKLGQQVISIDTAEDDAEEDGVEDEDLMMLNGRIVSMKRAKQKDDQNALVYEYEENEEEGGAGVVISGHQQKQQQKGSHQLDSWFAGMAQRLSIHHHQH